ncbi:MAG TPA: NADH-quinone oxidoreductase subunit H [Novimethylophilus sp.]|jgi:formate hydrogenlyase subunit 4|uniref:respiratory chain complex I subunit 1 family protein n=1 Tax=Novimethylophilus sp. TaxID=2137426 RepID=UPI002F3F93FF
MSCWLLQLINICIIPLLLMGVIRKTKALLQTRYGAPVLQPFYDLAKLLRKSETISGTASWVFIWSPRVGLMIAVLTAVCVPWAGLVLPEGWRGASNFLFVLYLLALGKFLTMLAAMDTGSAFGGLGASREATISLLVEPALVIGLGAFALQTGQMDLTAMYAAPASPIVAALVGCALIIAALAELSRMPVDDPTTHLELTMVHEAMILENSGRNLALIEYAGALRACLYFGLAAQTLLHVWPGFATLAFGWHYALSLGALFLLGIAVAVAEGILVKLKWRAVPNYLAFATALSLLAALVAAAQG